MVRKKDAKHKHKETEHRREEKKEEEKKKKKKRKKKGKKNHHQECIEGYLDSWPKPETEKPLEEPDNSQIGTRELGLLEISR
jgi:hypothetical protein